MNSQERYRQVARLHVLCLDQGFLATLGEQFLTRMYEAIDRTDGAILLTEEVEGHVVGFVAGGGGMGPIYRQMMRKPFQLATALAPALLSPAKVWRIVEILRYSGSWSLPAGVPAAELLSLAVAPEWRGKAVSERLYSRLVAQFLVQGDTCFRIIVGEALGPAHRFYQRMGAQPRGTIEVHGAARSILYVHEA